MPTPVKLDFSKAQTLTPAELDFSKSQPIDTQTAPPTVGGQLKEWGEHTALPAIRDLFSGIGASVLKPGAELSRVAHNYPILGHLMGAVPTQEQVEQYQSLATPPESSAGSVGNFLGNIGQFLIPGEGEEALVSLAPKALRTAARLGTSALTSGALTRAQGGNFSTGAALGAGGELGGMALRAVAPKLAESALRLGMRQRGFGKTPGIAALEETRGIRPETILESGRERMGDLMRELEGKVDAASQRPAPRIAGFLMPPVEEIPLHAAPSPRNPRMRPMAFRAGVNPEELLEPRSGNPMAPISEYPISNPHYLSGSEHPELSGRVTPIQRPQQVSTRMGILLRRPEMSGSFPPTIEANPSASLEPARSSLRGPLAEAQAEGAATRHGQIQKMLDFLHSNPVTGEAYGENVTPRKLLDIKRGLSDEHLRWNPDIHDQTVRAGRQAYRALDKELDRLVPESAPINQRVFSLLEVLRNAERETRTAGTGQRVMGRFAAHTGALTGAGLGGAMGYREGGIPGAIAGTIGGAVIPELIASPEGQMGTARLFHSAKNLRPGVAALAQIGRRNP